jgi:hypothetical protein
MILNENGPPLYYRISVRVRCVGLHFDVFWYLFIYL